MEIFSRSSLFILVLAFLVQTNAVGGNSVSSCGGIFEGDSGEFEYHRENVNVDDSTGSSVCIWMIKLLTKDGAGVSLKLEDLDENSVVNFYAEGEPTDPVKPPNTLNSTQINSAVELSGSIFIITLKSQVDQFETSPTKFVVSWTSIKKLSTAKSNSTGSKILPVELTSTNYFASGGEKGRYNFKNLRPHQKSAWILDAGFGGSLDAEVNIQFDSSCLSKFKSSNKSGMSPKTLCECSYFGLFEIDPSTGKLRSVNEFCGRSASSTFTKLSTQLIVFIYSMNPNSGSGESAQISWEKNKETTSPTTTTTEFSTSPEPEPPIKVTKCPLNSTMPPCTCRFPPFSDGVEIQCSGSTVNETTVEKAFIEIRLVNGIPENRGIHIYSFKLDQTELTELDLAPFYGSQMEFLWIYFNDNLTKFVTSGQPQDHGSINVYEFQIGYTRMNRQGFGDTLKYFSKELDAFHASYLDLSILDNSEESALEILPGLSTHTNIQYLSMAECNISVGLNVNAGSLDFRTLRSLRSISLSDNNIEAVGENTFDFECGFFSKYADIYFVGNGLNESSFHPNSGIAPSGCQTDLFLSSNQITSLPAPIFETFLDAHPGNSIDLEDNPLICDERVSWLKSRRSEFQSLVKGANCTNDPGHTVFDSDLIP